MVLDPKDAVVNDDDDIEDTADVVESDDSDMPASKSIDPDKGKIALDRMPAE